MLEAHISKLLLATNNAGKVRELSALLTETSFRITNPITEGIDLDVEETGTTFEENAAIKALAFAQNAGLLSIADDSGLEVDALFGEPGVRSARYGGEGASDADRIIYILNKLQGISWDNRKATFRSVLALADINGIIKIFHGECHGYIAFEPKGVGGFGYDPIFYLPSIGKSMSELNTEQKNEISHRGIAVKKAVNYLKHWQRDIRVT